MCVCMCVCVCLFVCVCVCVCMCVLGGVCNLAAVPFMVVPPCMRHTKVKARA